MSVATSWTIRQWCLPAGISTDAGEVKLDAVVVELDREAAARRDAQVDLVVVVVHVQVGVRGADQLRCVDAGDAEGRAGQRVRRDEHRGRVRGVRRTPGSLGGPP